MEGKELKIFYLRIARLYETAKYCHTWLDENDIFRGVAMDEAMKDAEFVASITGGKG
jgi:hypothetical protein